MDCETVQRENIPERYLAGTLDSQLKQEWELHYFSCDRCAGELATWQAIDAPLRAMAGSIRDEIRTRGASRLWLWAGVAAAVLLAGLGIGVIQRSHHTPAVPMVSKATPPEAAWAGIARLEPPAYQPPTLRSSASPAELQFHQAMAAYLLADYSQAIAGLQAALQLDPGAAAPRFFLGACDLLTGNAAAGTRELERVASGDSPFAQEARFDLAKAYLMQGNTEAALAALRGLADAAGEFREPARQLMARIAAPR